MWTRLNHKKILFVRCVGFIFIIMGVSTLIFARDFADHEYAEVKSLTVVLDNNYPPYSYMKTDGTHQGITVEQWQLFEQKTGIEVTLLPMQWSEAYSGMKQGKYDVIDTISYNKDRTVFLDYSSPYATIEVPIFYSSQISGITDAGTLKGFSVAVKKGDMAIKKLEEAGITNIVEYASAEELIQAANQEKVVVFVLGKPPAEFYLYKYGINEKFKYSQALYTSQFFRAVKKGDSLVLNAINDGFALISESEYEQINNKYLGSSLKEQSMFFDGEVILYTFGVLLASAVLAFTWRKSLKLHGLKQVLTVQNNHDALLEKLNRQRLFFDTLPDLFFVMSPEGIIVDYEGSTKEDLYIPPEVFLGKNIVDIYPPELAQTFFEAFLRTKETEETQRIQYTLPIAGVETWFEARIIRKDGLIIVVVRNIHEQHLLSESVASYVKTLELKNDEMERFLYILIHDLHSPLIGIKGYSEMLLKDYEQNKLDHIGSDLRKIDASATKAKHILEALIEYSRISRSDCHRILFSMKGIAQEVTTQLEPLAREEHIQLKVRDNLPSVFGDPKLIQDLLIRLFENAVIHMGKVDHAVVEMSFRNSETETIFTISDNGKGIQSKDVDRIFGLFEKGSPDSMGVGLGLSIARTIVEKHSGHIWLEKNESGGLTVCFTLSET